MLCSPRVDSYLLLVRRQRSGSGVNSSHIGCLRVFGLVLVLAFPTTKADGQSREEAVRAAREGRTDEAIRELQNIVASNSTDTAAALDLATILTWAKRP